MATTTNFKDIIDKPEWRGLAPHMDNTGALATPTTKAAIVDFRNRGYANPHTWFTTAIGNNFATYNYKNDGWSYCLTSNTMAGTLTQGYTGIFSPSNGPAGTLAAGATTTSVVLSTALPASVALNKLANRGDGLGYIIRIVGNSGGGSGKIEERRIVGNTSGTAPTIYVDVAFSFTPASGDRYELLSGKLYLLSTGAAKEFRSYDVATNFLSAALSVTNLPGTVGASWNNFVSLDESHVPWDKNPGEGFLIGASTYDTGGDFSKGCLLATATAAGTITGQASSGDAAVLTNEYRNFQIRIVEDTVTPTAVGQRRRITSHTAGASAVYTLASNWTVTPTATCKFVIENDNDKLLWLTSGSTVTYNYNITANTWDTTTWAARSVGPTSGFTYQAFGIKPDAGKNVRNSFIYSSRGATNIYDILDIAGAATGSWTNGLTMSYPVVAGFLGIGNNWIYAPGAGKGDYIYIQLGVTNGQAQAMFRFSMLTSTLESWTTLKAPAASTTSGNNKGGYALFQDGATSIGMIMFPKMQGSTTGEWYECLITR